MQFKATLSQIFYYILFIRRNAREKKKKKWEAYVVMNYESFFWGRIFSEKSYIYPNQDSNNIPAISKFYINKIILQVKSF